MRVVVCDTGPVLHLREAGVLDVLRHAGEVLIPAAVDDELTRLVDDWAATRRHLDYAAADVALTRLAQSSLWLSAAVLAEARTALGKLGSRP